MSAPVQVLVVVALIAAIAIAVLFGGAAIRSRREANRMRRIAAGDAEATLEQWLTDAAANASSGPLNRHILKHVGELFTEVRSDSDRNEWSASMHNLLAIYDRHHAIEQTAERRVSRMLLKYRAEPDTHTRPPEVKQLIAEIDKQKADRAAAAEKERQSRPTFGVYSYGGS